VNFLLNVGSLPFSFSVIAYILSVYEVFGRLTRQNVRFILSIHYSLKLLVSLINRPVRCS